MDFNERSSTINFAKTQLSDYRKKYGLKMPSQSSANTPPIESTQLPPTIMGPTNSHPKKSNLSFPGSTVAPNTGPGSAPVSLCITESFKDPNLVHNNADTVSILIIERNNLQRQLNLVQKELHVLKGSNKELLDANEELEERITQSETLVKNFRSESESQEKKIIDLTASLEREKEACQMFETSSTAAKVELNQLTARLQAKLNDCRELKDALESKNKNSTSSIDFEKEKKRLTDEFEVKLELGRRAMEIKENEKLALEKYVAEMNDKNEHNLKKIAELERLNNDEKLKLENKALFETVNELKSQNQELKNTLSSSSSERVTATRQNEELQALVKQKNLIIRDLIRRSESFEQLSRDRQSLMEKLNSDRETISKCTDQNIKLKDMLTERENYLDQLTTENRQLKDQLHTKASELESISSSLNNISIVDLSNWVQLLMDAACDLNSWFSHSRYLCRDMQLQITDSSLQSSYDQIVAAVDLLYSRNDHLSKVNAQLSTNSDEYCINIKELNREIVALKEKLSFLKMPSSSDDNSSSDEFKKLINILALEKQQLTEEVTRLKDTISHLSEEKDQQTIGNSATNEERVDLLMQEKAVLQEKVNKLDHLNVLLSEEVNAIGDYIHIYITQRTAMGIIVEKCAAYITKLQIAMVELYQKASSVVELLSRLSTQSSLKSEGAVIKDQANIFESHLNQFIDHLQSDECLSIFAPFCDSRLPANLPWADKLCEWKLTHPK